MLRSAWLLIAVAAACGGNAFHTDYDADEGSSGSAGVPSTAGKPSGGNAGSSSGAGGSSASPGGAGAHAGDPSSNGGDGGSQEEPATSPISKEGLVYWFAADSGVTETAGRISKWADQSGGKHDAVQQLANQRPLLTHTDLLPLPVVELDGASFLELPPIDAPIDGGLTFFAVAGRSEDAGCAAFLELSNGREIDDVFFGHSGLGAHFEVADIWYDTETEIFDLNVMRVLTIKQLGDATKANVEISANGAFAGTSEVPFPARLPRSKNFIGLSLYETCPKLIGGIGEIILYSRVLGRDEQRAVESYLETKWQLPDGTR